MSDAAWESPGRFLFDGKVIYEYPRRDLAWMLLFDGLHHRGQLSTYLRPMGGTVPIHLRPVRRCYSACRLTLDDGA